MQDINRWVGTARLCADPELRSTKGGTSVCELRVAVNGSRKVGDSYEDDPNFLSVVTFGRRAETCAEHLSKGAQIAVEGRLDQSNWEDREGNKRESVKIIADQVRFLGSKNGSSGSSSGGSDYQPSSFGGDDDIPF
jgi:single-strand DNA-binding protein